MTPKELMIAMSPDEATESAESTESTAATEYAATEAD